MVKDDLQKILGDVKLEHPNLESFGDYSFRGKLSIVNSPLSIIDKVAEVNGFVNIRLKTDYLVAQLPKLAQLDELPQLGQGKTVIVEYSSPNIAKHFGIGHFRSTVIGQVIYNLYRELGYRVIGHNHLGDWGTQFGKLLFMIDRYKEIDYDIDRLEKWYVEFHELAKNDSELEAEARKWFKRLEDEEPVVRKIWEKCVSASMREFSKVYKLLAVNIDNAWGESFYEKLMPEIIADAKAKGVATESEGALIIDTGHESPLMLLKSDGGTTYATRDLATILYRMRQFDPHKIIYEVGVEQTLYFKQLFEAAKRLGYLKNDVELIHVSHGLYLAPDGKKFSTRGGNTARLEDILKEAIHRAKDSVEVGVGALKYFDLLHSLQGNIVFDWEKLMALQGNSGPYLQYTYARIMSVRAKGQGLSAKDLAPSTQHLALNAEELSILRWIYRFPEVVIEATGRHSPNLLCNFLYELAQRFNTFYNKRPILKNEFRLLLTQSVGEVLKKGLDILGIATPEKM